MVYWLAGPPDTNCNIDVYIIIIHYYSTNMPNAVLRTGGRREAAEERGWLVEDRHDAAQHHGDHRERHDDGTCVGVERSYGSGGDALEVVASANGQAYHMTNWMRPTTTSPPVHGMTNWMRPTTTSCHDNWMRPTTTATSVHVTAAPDFGVLCWVRMVCCLR